MSKSTLVVLTLVMSLAMLGRQEAEPMPKRRGLDATLWVQTSSEWRAHCHQAYNFATIELDACLENEEWTAALEQLGDMKRSDKMPAIVVDIDETVLDNSPYQARMVLDGSTYSDESWKSWVDQCDAAPVPGALAFLIEASRKGIEVFYITNRTSDLEEATRKNLARFGFPLNTEIDTVLMKNEQEGWGSDKTSRRRLVAETHRILMLVGDDFGDFCGAAKADQETRRVAELSHGGLWGRGWFILPNPAYGSWKNAVVGFQRGLSPEDSLALELKALDPKRK